MSNCLSECKSAIAYAGKQGFNEALTTTVVLEVFEKMLGFHKYEDVEHQLAVDQRKQSYADLVLKVGQTYVPVEVKASTTPLDDKALGQLEDYWRLLSAKSKFGILTNGIEWVLYQFENDQRQVVAKVNFNKDEDAAILDSLYYFSKYAFEQGHSEKHAERTLYPEAQNIIDVLLSKKVLSAVRNEVKSKYGRTMDENKIKAVLKEDILANFEGKRKK